MLRLNHFQVVNALTAAGYQVGAGRHCITAFIEGQPPIFITPDADGRISTDRLCRLAPMTTRH